MVQRAQRPGAVGQEAVCSPWALVLPLWQKHLDLQSQSYRRPRGGKLGALEGPSVPRQGGRSLHGRVLYPTPGHLPCGQGMRLSPSVSWKQEGGVGEGDLNKRPDTKQMSPACLRPGLRFREMWGLGDWPSRAKLSGYGNPPNACVALCFPRKNSSREHWAYRIHPGDRKCLLEKESVSKPKNLVCIQTHLRTLHVLTQTLAHSLPTDTGMHVLTHTPAQASVNVSPSHLPLHTHTFPQASWNLWTTTSHQAHCSEPWPDGPRQLKPE